MTLQDKEQETLARLKAGDLESFRLFFGHWYPRLYAFAYRRLQDAEACQDLLQDVFSTLWEKRQQLDITETISGYLHGMVHHACLNHLRKKKSNWEKVHQLWEMMNPDPSGFPASEDGYEPIFLHETEAALQEGMDKLPDECRKIFLLSRSRGMKSKAIAEMLSLSPRTVETQIYRALQILKECLQKNK